MKSGQNEAGRTEPWLGSLLRTQRKERNLTLRKVAAEVDMDPSILGHIERGDRIPTNSQLERLASFYVLDFKMLQALAVTEDVQKRIGDPEVCRMAGTFLAAQPDEPFHVDNFVNSGEQRANKKE